MTGKPTPGPVVDETALLFAEALTASRKLKEAGYDGREAVKALPELMKLLREISNWLVCLPIAGPEGLAEAAPDFQEQIDALLDGLTKKGDTDDAA